MNENIKIKPSLKPIYVNLSTEGIIVAIGVYMAVKHVSLYIVVAFIGVGTLLVLLALIKNYFFYLSTTYIVGRDYIQRVTKFVRTKTTDIPTQNIRAIDIEQGIVERIFHIGTVKIATAATKGYELLLERVDNPFVLKYDIEKLIMQQENTQQEAQNE